MQAMQRHIHSVLACIGLLLLGAIFSFQTASPGFAAIEGCRGDPVVFLSTGILRLTVAVAAPADDVASVVYTIHAPKGTLLGGSVMTGGPLKDKESLVFDDDGKPGLIEVETLVTLTDRGSAAVTITAASGRDTVSSSGVSGRAVNVRVEVGSN